jgi:hypothetical protein
MSHCLSIPIAVPGLTRKTTTTVGDDPCQPTSVTGYISGQSRPPSCSLDAHCRRRPPTATRSTPPARPCPPRTPLTALRRRVHGMRYTVDLRAPFLPGCLTNVRYQDAYLGVPCLSTRDSTARAVQQDARKTLVAASSPEFRRLAHAGLNHAVFAAYAWMMPAQQRAAVNTPHRPPTPRRLTAVSAGSRSDVPGGPITRVGSTVRPLWWASAEPVAVGQDGRRAVAPHRREAGDRPFDHRVAPGARAFAVELLHDRRRGGQP